MTETKRERKPIQRHLVGKVVIMEYLGVSREGFEEFRRLGLPCRKVAGKLYAHAENIDMFLRQITATTLKEDDAGAE